jgi:hypothetical protein
MMVREPRRSVAGRALSARRGVLRLGLLALVVASVLGGKCEAQGPGFFGIVSVAGTGDIVGTVTVDGVPRPDAVVILREGATTIDTFVADASGNYTFLNLDPGTYTLTTTIEGAVCNEVTASVVADELTDADLPCATPTTGTVQGRVMVNGEGEAEVPVILRLGATTLATTTTDVQGNYQFSGASPGMRTVLIQPPTGVTCTNMQRNVTVVAGQTATVDFDCTRTSVDFTVLLGTPPPGWTHDMPGISSLECKVIRTSPAQPGATFSATTTGPVEGGPSGVLSPQPITGTLNANGQAALQVRIDRVGTYINVVTVTSGTVTKPASATVTVTSAANTCPQVDP